MSIYLYVTALECVFQLKLQYIYGIFSFFFVLAGLPKEFHKGKFPQTSWRIFRGISFFSKPLKYILWQHSQSFHLYSVILKQFEHNTDRFGIDMTFSDIYMYIYIYCNLKATTTWNFSNFIDYSCVIAHWIENGHFK